MSTCLMLWRNLKVSVCRLIWCIKDKIASRKSIKLSELPPNSYFVVLKPGVSSLLLEKGHDGKIKPASTWIPLDNPPSPDTEIQQIDIKARA